MDDELVCPWCEYNDPDPWEIGEGEEGAFKTWCDSCNKPILVSRSFTIHIETIKRDDD